MINKTPIFITILKKSISLFVLKEPPKASPSGKGIMLIKNTAKNKNKAKKGINDFFLSETSAKMSNMKAMVRLISFRIKKNVSQFIVPIFIN